METLVDINGDFIGYINVLGEIIRKNHFITERIKRSLK